LALKLMYISNDVNIAKIAQENGVDRIFIDLEILGKEERQGHLDTVISRHRIEDIKKIRPVLNKTKLLVRVNPIYKGSKSEIRTVIECGADIVMLPFFKSKSEVQKFIEYIDDRAQSCLLLETPEAVNCIDEILKIDGIDEIHIGLNDLHLGYKKKFMFELLADGTVEKICRKIHEKNIPYGFGGIARLGKGMLPAELVIAEHYRIGSSMAILSRSFCNLDNYENLNEAKDIISEGVREIREYENILKHKDKGFFENNRLLILDRVLKIKQAV